jgi:hypothetical protein
LERQDERPSPYDPAPLPSVAIRFSHKRLIRALVAASCLVIVVSLAAQLLLVRTHQPVGWVRSVWLGVICMWLLVITAVGKRRNIAKAAVYLTILVSAVCAYWDYLTGWHRWSLTYAVPIVCTGAGLAVLIIVRVMRVETGDHILYTSAVAVLGVVPILFVIFGWSSNSWTGIVSACVRGVILALLPRTRGREIRRELAKRLHL